MKILATIDGVPYRGTLVRMGKPCHLLLVRKEIRQQIEKQVGDEVQVFLEEDTEPRVVDVPEDFQQALDAEPVANQHFASLSYTHQKEYVSWIMEAKREETRRSRIMKAVDMLKQGKKTR